MYNQNEGVALEQTLDDLGEPVDPKQDMPKGQASGRPRRQNDGGPWGEGPGETGHRRKL